MHQRVYPQLKEKRFKMKNYIKPEIEEIIFTTEVITGTSVEEGDDVGGSDE